MSPPRCIRSAAVLQVGDVEESAEFYKEKLGFTVGGFWGEPPCFCIAGRDTVTIFLDQTRDGRTARNQYWAAYVYVDDVDALHAEFAARGVDIARGPEEMAYGCREFDVRDPDGHLIAFGQDLQPSEHGPGL